MHLATWDTQGLMVLPHGLGIWRFQQAVHLAVRIVEQLNLANAEFVGLLILCFLCDLLDRLIWELQVVVEIHELRHRFFLYLLIAVTGIGLGWWAHGTAVPGTLLSGELAAEMKLGHPVLRVGEHPTLALCGRLPLVRRGSLRSHAIESLWRSALTVVLIHGGGATARFWDRLIPLLNVEAVAVNLPGRADRPADLATLSVEDEVASVVRDIESVAADGPVVLVAHSSGGLVVPGVVAALRGRIRSVVLNAALVPAEGGCGIDCMKEQHREGLRMAVAGAEAAGSTITLPGPPEDPESFRNVYGGDPLDDDTLAFVVDPVRCVPDTVHHYFQPVRWSEVTGVPMTYVLNERDRPVLPAAQEEMVLRLPQPATVIRVDSGHLLPVTAPATFAGILARAMAGAPAPAPE
jgi:pimeloyl-ACP methyl ester carboxylesterase